MPIIARQDFLEPYVTLLRDGTPEDPYVNITETIRLVPNINMDAGVYNIAVLREIPLLTQGVVAKINGIQLTEIRDSLKEIDENHFKVDYTNGRVYLSAEHTNEEVNFAYKGRGVILITSERILLSYGNNFENIYTLDRYVQEHMGEVNIGELENLKTNAKDKVVNAINEVWDDIQDHIDDKNNPHDTKKENIGLGNVDNTSDMNKPVSIAQQQALDNLESEIRTDMDNVDENLQQQIDALHGSYIYIGKILLDTSDVTQALLTARAKSIMGTTELQTGWVLIDNEKHDWYWSGTLNEWLDLDTTNIYPATNTTMGIVQGNSNVSITNGLMTVLMSKDSEKFGGQLPSYYGVAADVANKVNKDGDTMTGKLTLPIAITSSASMNIPHGTTPTTLVNGDIWTTTASILARINGTTRTFYHNGNAATAALSTVSQSEAEAGTATTTRAWTAQRVRQAIDARAWTNETLLWGGTEPDPVVGKTIIWVDIDQL